jgi:hypothetical protein
MNMFPSIWFLRISFELWVFNPRFLLILLYFFFFLFNFFHPDFILIQVFILIFLLLLWFFIWLYRHKLRLLSLWLWFRWRLGFEYFMRVSSWWRSVCIKWRVSGWLFGNFRFFFHIIRGLFFDDFILDYLTPSTTTRLRPSWLTNSISLSFFLHFAFTLSVHFAIFCLLRSLQWRKVFYYFFGLFFIALIVDLDGFGAASCHFGPRWSAQRNIRSWLGIWLKKWCGECRIISKINFRRLRLRLLNFLRSI